jgi:hypothetical protein
VTRTWKDIWEARRIDSTRPSQLAQLMAADGLDSGFSEVGEAAWRAVAARIGGRLGVTPASSLFEVGCGAGAFLYPFDEAGSPVGGLDASATLVGYARAAMPGARLDVGDAAKLDIDEKWDFVVSFGVFLYFPTLEYAAGVLARMAAKARRGIAILDVADAAKRAEAMAMRRGSMGAAEYDDKYRGLDHLFIARDWMRDTLRGLNLTDIAIEDQSLADYGNAPFRYNVFARTR